jgi:hypothetical protein
MSPLAQYVIKHTERGECKCGWCSDVGSKPDPCGAHTADLIFFKAAIRDNPRREEFESLTRKHVGTFAELDPFDGKEHSYIELGGWLGDQGLALRYMALGYLLGIFQLLTPRSVLPGLNADLVMKLAMSGGVAVVRPVRHQETA